MLALCLKTTITVDPKRWQAFQIQVMKKEGQARRLNAVICKLIDGYTNGTFEVKA